VGFGDDIMATARVRALYAKNPVPVLITGLDNRPRWSEIWDNNPKIARRRDGPIQVLLDGPGARPYLDYTRLTHQHYFFREFDLQPGEIFLTDQEKAGTASHVFIEPHVRSDVRPNKDWGFQRFQELVAGRPELPWAQCDYGRPLLEGVKVVPTGSFREACGVLSGAIAAVMPEGGLHHAAAALGIPAVVIFGAYIPPTVTGYESHVNLARHVPEVVGLNRPDPRAQAALASIGVEEVMTALDTLLP
jgi:hypothetical protein